MKHTTSELMIKAQEVIKDIESTGSTVTEVKLSHVMLGKKNPIEHILLSIDTDTENDDGATAIMCYSFEEENFVYRNTEWI